MRYVAHIVGFVLPLPTHQWLHAFFFTRSKRSTRAKNDADAMAIGLPDCVSAPGRPCTANTGNYHDV